MIKSIHIAAGATLGLLLMSNVRAYDGEQLSAGARISIEQARKIALQQVPGGRIKHEELEKEAGGSGLRYSFDVIGQHGEREVGVDARTAKVLENSAEGADRD